MNSFIKLDNLDALNSNLRDNDFQPVKLVIGAPAVSMNCPHSCSAKATVYDNKQEFVLVCSHCLTINTLKKKLLEPSVALTRLTKKIGSQQSLRDKLLFMATTARYYWSSKGRYVDSVLDFTPFDAQVTHMVRSVFANEATTKQLTKQLI